MAFKVKAFRHERKDESRTLFLGKRKERFHDFFGWGSGTFAGLIIYTEGTTFYRNFAHERVHVLQHDSANIVWSRPLERFVLTDIVPFGGDRRGYPHLGLYSLLKLPIHDVVDYAKRPWEREAFFLMRN